MINLLVTSSSGGTYTLTDEDKTYLKSKAVNGVIPFRDHARAMNEILNGMAPHQKGAESA